MDESDEKIIQKEADEKPPDQVLNANKAKDGFFKTLIKGDCGLAKTFWVYGVFGIIFLNFLVLMVLTTGLNYPEPPLWLIIFTYVSMAAMLGIIVMVCIGVWRAASKYRGKIIWSILAKVSVILVVITMLKDYVMPQ